MDTDKFLKDYLLTYNDYSSIKKRTYKKIAIIIGILFLIGIYFRPITYLREKIEYNATAAKKLNENKRRNSKYRNYFSDFSPSKEKEENVNLKTSNMTQNGKYPMPIRGTVTSRFGYRQNPFRRGGKDYHTGIDIAGYKHHAEVSTIEKGVVVFSGVQRGYGNCILIHHNNGEENFYTMYAHLSKRYVVKGQAVERGNIIGLEGGGKGDPNPGYSTGHHLHFEVRRNESIKSAINPAPYIL